LTMRDTVFIETPARSATCRKVTINVLPDTGRNTVSDNVVIVVALINS
jgi:hypothetical protein